MSNTFKITLVESGGKLKINAPSAPSAIMSAFAVTEKAGEYTCTVDLPYDGVFGFGEKFDRVNQKGHKVLSSIIEKCFAQGEFTYCPVPFFFTRDGFGFFVDTLLSVRFDFTGKISFSFDKDCRGALPDIYLFCGTPKQILNGFTALTGRTKEFPKWVYGAWMSSNRWCCDEDIYEQLEAYDKHNLPANVMVIEAWSDESTYYIFNGARYPFKKGDEAHSYSDFDFSDAKFKNPKKLIEDIHSRNIKVLLWELPVYCAEKLIRGDGTQRLINNEYVMANHECVMAKDGTPYTILPGNWYAGSCIPDFGNPQTVKHWFAQKQYLLDEVGIDGFKTDGGEFIYRDDLAFHSGLTGAEMKNGYAQSYLRAYEKFVGSDRIIYSRAGYTGQQAVSVHWAGDQESNWDEYRAVIKAGISATASGIAVWGFDLAGFAGYLPSRELYMRSTQTAVFAPIMQWHSEPAGNGPPTPDGSHKINDRSPWNMADFLKDPELIDELRFHYNLRSNLIPYLFDLADKSRRTGIPIMKHLIIEYPDDANCIGIEDQFMLGDILVAPVLDDGISGREVYLPEGEWIDIYDGGRIGSGRHAVKLRSDRTPAYLKSGGCIALNLGESGELGSFVGNALDKYCRLTFLVSGSGEYSFVDDMGNRITIEWKNGKSQTKENLTGIPFTVKFI